VSDVELPQLLLHHAIERFLFLEAELLDRQDFAAWLNLLDDDVAYLMPTQAVSASGGDAPEGGIVHSNSYMDETKAALERRVRRLALPTAWSEHPPTRTCRFVSNVRVVPEAEGLFTVASSLLVYRSRLAHDGQLIAAARLDHIRRVDTDCGWRLRRREVRLLDTVIGMHNLSIIL
jgi:3-phenylpropionate/trans-cinnamate dioxygenase subunit beta